MEVLMEVTEYHLLVEVVEVLEQIQYQISLEVMVVVV